jgi:toluene monooxygenase system protein E
LKTYSHFNRLDHLPNDYEVKSTNLNYSVDGKLEINSPMREWYEKYKCKFTCKDWNSFFDPEQLTYTTYTKKRKESEEFIKHLFEIRGPSLNNISYSKEWISLLELVLTPMRFPLHALQMVSSYVAHLAPNSRITIAALFQSADEVQNIEVISTWIRSMRGSNSNFGTKSREMWQNNRSWQPIRKILEELLIVYDWNEAFIALNLSVKPMLKGVFYSYLKKLCENEESGCLPDLLTCLIKTSDWHEAWSWRLCAQLVNESSENEEKIGQLLVKWMDKIEQIISELGFYGSSDFKLYSDTIQLNYRSKLKDFGITSNSVNRI